MMEDASDPQSKSKSSGEHTTWILPVGRLQAELGVSSNYKAGGSVVLIWPCGTDFECEKQDGLQHARWKDVVDMRTALIISHLKGRPGNSSYEGKERAGQHTQRVAQPRMEVLMHPCIQYAITYTAQRVTCG